MIGNHVLHHFELTKLSTYFFRAQVVAALPEHAHLFGEFGCFEAMGLPKRECGKATRPEQTETAEIETPLDPSFYPLELNSDQDQIWYDIVKANIPAAQEEHEENI